MYAYRNPSVCSLKLVATFPFKEDIMVLQSFTLAITTNFYMLPVSQATLARLTVSRYLYMLPERELASP